VVTWSDAGCGTKATMGLETFDFGPKTLRTAFERYGVELVEMNQASGEQGRATTFRCEACHKVAAILFFKTIGDQAYRKKFKTIFQNPFSFHIPFLIFISQMGYNTELDNKPINTKLKHVQDIEKIPTIPCPKLTHKQTSEAAL
jgi:hypothetical protein